MLHLLFVGITFITAVLGIPTWETFSSRASIGSLVPGSSVIEALGGYEVPQVLSLSAPPGVAGNVTITMRRRSRSSDLALFFLHHNRLFQFTNETSILNVNVLNTTAVEGEPMPYKLAVSPKREGLRDAMFRWRGTLLHYELGNGPDQTFFYVCKNASGETGIYMLAQADATPPGCTLVTLHSFNHLELIQQRKEQSSS
ncbi:hypothetical protein BV25DRAFT_1986293 [Artomyces pyxidatus]|uniref:Uncharacterized protein n=1 Tax=Artomyces pyxidatus TaxID=48021 RepID=A0ACB8TJU7_9AGAM|nr:hypothetical protein BV25DRAFT_1986293 [Artomyces pyxidatus]